MFFSKLKIKENKIDLLILLVITLIVVAFKFNTLNDPYFWDDLGGVIAPALDMFDHGFRFIHPYHNFGHPPLQPLLLAITWKIFGYSIISAHLLTTIIVIGGLFYLYKLGQLLVNRTVGVSAVVLLFFSQLYFAQTGLLNDTMPLTTFGIMTVYYYLSNKKPLFILSAIALLLTKETGAVLLLAIFIHYHLIEWKKLNTEKNIRPRRISLGLKKIFSTLFNIFIKSWYILLPLIPLFAWFAYHKQMLGWAFRTDLMANSLNPLLKISNNLIYYFIYDFRPDPVNTYNFILTAIIIISFIKYRKLLSLHTLSILIIILYWFLFAYTDNLPRYFIPLLPFYFLIAGHAIYLIAPTKKYNYLIITVVTAIFITLNFTGYTGCRSNQCHLLETNMEYRDFIKIRQEAITFVEQNYPNKQIITQWPMSDILTDPRYGYVKKPFSIINATTYKRDEYTSTTENFNKKYLLSKKGAIVLYDCNRNDLLISILNQPNVKTTLKMYNGKSQMISEIF